MKKLFIVLFTFISFYYAQAQVCDTWVQTANSSPFDFGTTTVTFATNNYGYVASFGPSGVDSTKNLFRYDPSNDSWTLMNGYPRRSFAFGFSGNNRLYIVTLDNKLFEYNIINNIWNEKASYNGSKRNNGVTSFAIDNKYYIGLGRYSIPMTATIFRHDFNCYDAASNTWSSIGIYPGNACLSAFSFSLNGKGYVGGGKTSLNVSNYDMYEYETLMLAGNN